MANAIIEFGEEKVVTDPYEAAKKIRALARELIDQLDYAQTKASTAELTSLTSARIGVVNLLDPYGYPARIKNAASSRRPNEIRAEVESMLVQIRKISDDLEKHNQQVVKPTTMGKDNTYINNSKDRAKEISKLAQSLPTVSSAPVLPVEQTLRAIATILKNAGFFDEKGKPIPYGQNIDTQEDDGDEDDD